jgi:PleD family two-component response regulator
MVRYSDKYWIITTGTTVDYCSSHSESMKISYSYDARYYDEIITRLRLQMIEGEKPKKQPEEGELHDQKGSKTILLADDEPDSCMTFQAVLEDAGFECISYTDPVKALREFKPYFYDLILLDSKTYF